MATIPNQATGLRHVRKTISPNGGANNGLLGDQIPVFTTTGRVLVVYATAFVTNSLVCAAGGLTSIDLLVGGTTFFFSHSTVDLVTANKWWDTGGFQASFGDSQPADAISGGATHRPQAISGNVTLWVQDDTGGANVTDGDIVVDFWYLPITDNGALAGDDIDIELTASLLTTALTEAYAADGAAPTLAQLLFMIWGAVAEFSISGTTLTVKKLDGSTTAMTFTLDSATAPTSRTRAT